MSPGLTRLASLPYCDPGNVALSHESGQRLAGVQQSPRAVFGTSQIYHRVNSSDYIIL